LTATSGMTAGAGFHSLTLTGIGNLTVYANGLGATSVGNLGADTIYGGAGNATITGGAGYSTIYAGAGNDRLSAGKGSGATFVFGQGSGQDVITNFNNHSAIDISAYLNAGLQPTITDGTSGLTISFSTGETIQLLGVHPASLIPTPIGYI
jgi:Ca2+-binding RTX toxin-like protein